MMTVNEQIQKQLLSYKKATISLEGLETLVQLEVSSYESFARLILSLEEQGILEMVKSKGRNYRTPSLAYRYRIQKKALKNDYHSLLKSARLQLHPSIHLDAYYTLEPSQWEEDFAYLEKIHDYISMNGFPEDEVPAPERSVELLGDEKWITDKGGKELLERVKLWEKLKVIPVSDPLMFAVNPMNIHKEDQAHLIVENKTTYQALLDALPETNFSTLIYGSGNKIVKSIEQFERQFPVEQVTHHFYYFGDIDNEGVSIWYRLAQKYPVEPAIVFYQACMRKKELAGKTNQRVNNDALQAFTSYFLQAEKNKIKDVLEAGKYYPQEVLKTHELQHIWRNWSWI